MQDLRPSIGYACAVAAQMGLKPEAAEEAAAAALAYCWETWDRQRSSWTTYLYRCVRWQVLTLSRQRAMRRRELLRPLTAAVAESCRTTPLDEAIGRELAEAASAAIDALPAWQREPLLAVLSGQRPQEVAETLGRPYGSVRQSLLAGRRRVAKALGQWQEGTAA